MSTLDFSTTIGNAWFPAPTFTASGCASSGRELAQFFPLKDMGGVVTKSVMSKPRPGRPTPRMAETPSGMLNSIGLQGPALIIVQKIGDHHLIQHLIVHGWV